jgi:hypothetical protein
MVSIINFRHTIHKISFIILASVDILGIYLSANKSLFRNQCVHIASNHHFSGQCENWRFSPCCKNSCSIGQKCLRIDFGSMSFVSWLLYCKTYISQDTNIGRVIPAIYLLLNKTSLNYILVWLRGFKIELKWKLRTVVLNRWNEIKTIGLKIEINLFISDQVTDINCSN